MGFFLLTVLTMLTNTQLTWFTPKKVVQPNQNNYFIFGCIRKNLGFFNIISRDRNLDIYKCPFLKTETTLFLDLFSIITRTI